MKIKLILLILFVVLILASGCGYKANIKDVSAESIIKNDPNVDLFLMNEIVYVNAINLDWVKEVEFEIIDGTLGKILRTGIRKDFRNFDATKLSIESYIYKVKARNDIVIIKEKDLLIPYLAWVEG